MHRILRFGDLEPLGTSSNIALKFHHSLINKFLFVYVIIIKINIEVKLIVNTSFGGSQ